MVTKDFQDGYPKRGGHAVIIDSYPENFVEGHRFPRFVVQLDDGWISIRLEVERASRTPNM